LSVVTDTAGLYQLLALTIVQFLDLAQLRHGRVVPAVSVDHRPVPWLGSTETRPGCTSF